MMDKHYVSEFTNFISHYMEDHPELVDDQRRGWRIYWEPKVVPAPPEVKKEDIVPADNYGFSWSAWHADAERADARRAEKPAGSVH